MKMSATKLKKLRTKTVYGFRMHRSGGNNFMDPTTITVTTGTTTATTTTTGGSMIF
jgi:hypothetical protein